MITNIQKIQLYFHSNWNGFTNENDSDLLLCFNRYKDANNTVKNIIRGFISYMKKRADSLILECLDNEG